MQTRGKSLLLALSLAATAIPGAAWAQIPAPRLVEDGDDAVEEAPARRAPARAAPDEDPAAPSPVPSAPRTPAPPAAAPSAAPLSSRAGEGAPPARPPEAPARAASSPPTPPPTPPTPPAADLARRIEPVSVTHARLMELWGERRVAQREADPVRAERAEKAFLAARRQLAIENLVTLAAVEIRASRRALDANLPTEAVAHARVAVELAPDLPDSHLALARARFAEAPGSPGDALAALGEAFAAAAREPHTIRALYGDLFSAGFAAVFVSALASVLLLLLARIRLFLHDFHHLPLLRGTASAQASLLAVVLLAAPVAFGLGPVMTAAVVVLAIWAYLSMSERLVVTVALAVVLALPWGAGVAARLTAWTGSLAEVVHHLEHGAVADEEAAEIAARYADEPAPAALYAALGRHHKRRGNLGEALRYYGLAAAADAQGAEVQVNVGNVLFLQGDLEGAKAAYLAATDRAAGDLVVLGAAHYGLSKLYLRTSDMPQSAAAREKAEREAGEFLRRHGSDEDFSANRYLVDVPVADEDVRGLAAADATARAMSVWVQDRLAGALPRSAWPWAPGGLLALAWLLTPLLGRVRLARACAKCGGAACRRCDAATAGTELCSQCVNVFVHKGLVDARDRLRKEAQVRRHRQLVQVATRTLSIVGGGAGQLFHGAAARGALLLAGILFVAFVLWFWRGIMPPPQPSPYVLVGKLVLAAPLGAGLWAFAIRDAFKRTE